VRKASIAFLVCLAFGAFVLAAGCGGDTGQAKQYMKTAEAYYDQVATDSQALAGKITAAFNGATDPAKMQAAVAKLNTFLDSMEAKADKAKASYTKMKSLKGVSDYVKYAEMQIELMGLVKQATGQLRNVMGQIAAAVSAGDNTALATLQKDFEAGFNKISSKISTLEQQASKFKSQKNL
jgi:hypothetical protein